MVFVLHVAGDRSDFQLKLTSPASTRNTTTLATDRADLAETLSVQLGVNTSVSTQAVLSGKKQVGTKLALFLQWTGDEERGVGCPNPLSFSWDPTLCPLLAADLYFAVRTPPNDP
jgi:hypothetical protein